MDKENRTFWEGFLGGIRACEHAIDESDDESVVRASIGMIKKRAETLLTSDVLNTFETYKTDAESKIAWTEIVHYGNFKGKVR